MTKAPYFFLFAGEPSGDLHGAQLLKSLKKLFPESKASGVVGPEMRRQKVKSFLEMENFQVMGFGDVFWSLPKLIRHFKSTTEHIIKTQPDAVILIDYPGFNLRLAKALRKKGYSGKIVHYISPSVWAWHSSRIYDMEKSLDLLLTIYPFEAKYYQHTSLKVKFIGNPLKQYISNHNYQEDWRKLLRLPKETPIVALFPGSRPSEIHRNFPIQLQAAEMLLAEKKNRIFAVSCSGAKNKEILLELIKKSTLKHGKDLFIVPKEFNYELMKDCHAAIAKSGTVTLELALHNTPTVVIYKMSWINSVIAKYLLRIKLPHYCIVNILAAKRVFPELIEEGLSAKNIFKQLNLLDSEGPIRSTCIEECQKIEKLLENASASDRAALSITEELN